jgi:phosphoserine phosphatase
MDRSVLVLTSAAGVPDAAVEAAVAAFPAGTEPPLRLAGTAVEIGFGGPAPGVALSGIDANIVPAGERRKRLLIADMDSTIINVECIDELADYAGVKPQVAAITEAAMRGELDFEASLVQRAALFVGLEAHRLEAILERATLLPGAETLVATMHACGAWTALISGGFTIFAERIAAQLGFHAVHANVLEIENGQLTGRVREPIIGPQGKADLLKRLAAEGGLAHSETLAAGDGANDVAMLAAAGLGVAFRAKPVLAAQARAAANGAVVTHGDLTAVLHLQGYEAREFARRA